MKKTSIIIVIAAFFSISLLAQKQDNEPQFKNKFMAGGNINLDMQHSSSTDFTIRPMAGYFISNKFAVGLLLEYQLFENIEYELDQNNLSDPPSSVAATGNAFGFYCPAKGYKCNKEKQAHHDS